jgi:hypothetical protein
MDSIWKQQEVKRKHKNNYKRCDQIVDNILGLSTSSCLKSSLVIDWSTKSMLFIVRILYTYYDWESYVIRTYQIEMISIVWILYSQGKQVTDYTRRIHRHQTWLSIWTYINRYGMIKIVFDYCSLKFKLEFVNPLNKYDEFYCQIEYEHVSWSISTSNCCRLDRSLREECDAETIFSTFSWHVSMSRLFTANRDIYQCTTNQTHDDRLSLSYVYLTRSNYSVHRIRCSRVYVFLFFF